MGLWCWIFYIVAGIVAYFILNVIDSKYRLNKIQKIIFSIILMMIVSGICFEMALNVTDNIFLMFVFMMICIMLMCIVVNKNIVKQRAFEYAKSLAEV